MARNLALCAHRVRLRRAAFLLPVLLLTLTASYLAWVAVGGLASAADATLLVLFAFNVGWLAVCSWQVVLGFVLHCLGRRGLPELERRLRDGAAVPSGRSQTAVVMPVHDEDPAGVFARVEVIARSLARAGWAGDVDLHVLSASRDLGIAAEEEARYRALLAGRARSGERSPAVHYRRRPDNAGRKAGNVADFCRAHGGSYDFMVVLDADSLMTGRTIRLLIGLMEQSPGVGIIQTVPYLARRGTLFGRARQFAARLQFPLLVKGLEFWQHGHGNYWGHNAIVRVAAFARHCALPVLPGRPPLGGELLCHDVVEAALMHRAGWEVRLLPELGGSWEEVPANLIDFAGRDRRWCQGNLQHLRLLPWRSLRRASHLHLTIGIVSYVSAPAWLATLLLSLALLAWRGLEASATVPGMAVAAGRPEAAVALLWLTFGMMLLPVALGLAAALAHGPSRRAFGGAGRLVASAVLEQALSTLMTPALLLFYTRFVATTLAGRVVSWDAQPRGDRAVPFAEALRAHLGHTLFALALAACALWLGILTSWWVVLLLAGLGLSSWLTAWSSSAAVGGAARRLGLFLVAEETEPAAELVELDRELRQLPSEAAPAPERVAVALASAGGR
jgi:membrane glycosyltransferase